MKFLAIILLLGLTKVVVGGGTDLSTGMFVAPSSGGASTTVTEGNYLSVFQLEALTPAQQAQIAAALGISATPQQFFVTDPTKKGDQPPYTVNSYLNMSYPNDDNNYALILPGTLTVSGETASFSGYGSGVAVNAITGALSINSGGITNFNNNGIGTTINAIIGGITVENGGTAYLVGNMGSIATILSNGVNITGGTANFYNNGSGTVTNTITSGVTVTGGNTDFSSYGSGTVTNTITSGVTVSGGEADFYNNNSGSVTNTITSGVTVVGGTANFSNYGTGTTTNTVTGGVTASSDGGAYFFNDGGGSVVNKITGTLSVADKGTTNFSNYGSGTATNTVSNGVNVSGGEADFYNNSSGTVSNTVTGDVTVSGGKADFSSHGTGTTTNTVSNGVTVAGGKAYFYNNGSGTVTNTVTGGINVSGGYTYFSNGGTGTTTNTVTSGVNVSDNGSIAFSNGRGNTTNTVTGGVTVAGNGRVNFTNSNEGTATTAIDTVELTSDAPIDINSNISNAPLVIGGYNSTTTIGTFTWNKGLLAVNVDTSQSTAQAGNTVIDNFIIADAPLTLLVNPINLDANYIDSSPTPITLLTARNINRAPSNITIYNGSALTEISSVLWGSNNLNIVTQTVATALAGQADPTISDLNFDSVTRVTGDPDGTAVEAGENTFRQDAELTLANYANALKTLTNTRDFSLENVARALTDQKPLIMPVAAKPIKIWFNPYYNRLRDTVEGYRESAFGGILGGDYWFKRIKTAVGATCGFGNSLTVRHDRRNHTRGRQFNFGLYLAHGFLGHALYTLNLNATRSTNRQRRVGKPTPDSGYLATALYHSRNLSFTNELSYAFKFDGGLSLRPNLGLALNRYERFKFSENAPANYAQTYKKLAKSQSEIYGGLGFRKKIIGDERYVGKFTAIYEMGKKSGGKTIKDRVYVASNPNGVNITTTLPGGLTHYLTLIGSVTNPVRDLKFSSTFNATLQKGQRSYRFGLRTDYRF